MENIQISKPDHEYNPYTEGNIKMNHFYGKEFNFES